MPFILFVSFWGKNQRSSWILCSSCPINRRDIRHNSKTSHNIQRMSIINSTGKHSWVREIYLSAILFLTKLWFDVWIIIGFITCTFSKKRIPAGYNQLCIISFRIFFRSLKCSTLISRSSKLIFCISLTFSANSFVMEKYL